MKRLYWIVFMLIFALNSTCYAEMYVWVDQDGVKHFTDTPPNPNEASPDQVKQSETSEYVFSHRLYKRTGDLEYCGDYKLPDRTEKNSNELLMKVQKVYENAIKNRKNLSRELQSVSSKNIKRDIQKLINEYECASEWAASVIKELEHTEP